MKFCLHNTSAGTASFAGSSLKSLPVLQVARRNLSVSAPLSTYKGEWLQAALCSVARVLSGRLAVPMALSFMARTCSTYLWKIYYHLRCISAASGLRIGAKGTLLPGPVGEFRALRCDSARTALCGAQLQCIVTLCMFSARRLRFTASGTGAKVPLNQRRNSAAASP